MNSFRLRLICGSLAGITVFLVLGSGLAFVMIKTALYAEFDGNLFQRAVVLKSAVREDKGKVDLGRLGKGDELLGHERGVDFVHLYRTDGETLIASREWTETALPRFGGPLDAPVFRELVLPGGTPGRSVGLEFNAQVDLTKKQKAQIASGEIAEPLGSRFQLVLAKVDTVAPSLVTIKRLLCMLWASCSLLSGLWIWWVVRQSLHPLDLLQRGIGRLRDTVSGQRLVLRNPPVELRPVLAELNRLLERVEAALIRERNLTSHLAHELRTPIAGMLSTLEVTLSRSRSAGEYREAAEECLEIVKRLHWLASNLLSISRIEAGNVQLEHHPLLMEKALAEWWLPFVARAESRGIRVDWELVPGAALETDPEFLRVVVTNLFDNAVSYTPPGGTVRIKANAQGTISIANNAAGIKAAVTQHVFEPFWRSNGSRDQAEHHAGLGLGLCKRIVVLLGGRISAHVQEQEGIFEVRVEMV